MAVQRLAFVFDAGTFAVMKSLLESEGIGVLDLAYGGHVAIAGADQGYYLQVLDEDREQAAELLREHGFEKYIVSKPA
jgi:hypothetical protein